MSGIKKVFWIFMLGMLAMVFIIVYPAEFEVMDKLQSTNTTWTTANTTLAASDPHGEVLANWFPYLFFATFIGALIYAGNIILKKGQDRR